MGIARNVAEFRVAPMNNVAEVRGNAKNVAEVREMLKM